MQKINEEQQREGFRYSQQEQNYLKPSQSCLQKMNNTKIKIIWVLLIACMCTFLAMYHRSISLARIRETASSMLQQSDQHQQENIDYEASTLDISGGQKPINELQVSQINYPDFEVPQKVWIYADQQEKQSFYVQRCLENIKHYAANSNYTVNFIGQKNIDQILSELAQKKIKETVNKVVKNHEGKQNNQNKIDIVRRQLISFWVLHENGGVLLEKNVLLTENFDWLRQINTSPFVNRGRMDQQAQYFAFFDINLGSPVAQVSKPHAKADYERYMIKSPGLETFFFAAIAKGAFLARLLEELHKILESPDYLSACRKTFEMRVGDAERKDPYEYGIALASHIVIHERQLELDRLFSDKSRVDRFAVDEYGLFTINSRYFPRKVRDTFENMFTSKIYRNLALYSLEELEQTTGPQRYVVMLPFDKQIGDKLQKTIDRKNSELIHPSSFVAKYLLLGNPTYEYVLQKEVERPVTDLNAPRWDALPKIVWLFWYTGLERASIGNAVCIANLRRRAAEAGFEVREVNNSNIEHYIGAELNARFDRAIREHKIPVYAQTKSNFVRKAIIAKYGGVYLDVSYVALESLDWILDIARYPSQFVFNRFRALPKVLMFFHPHFGQPFGWDYDPRANTKSMELTAYENNFIIAEPGQALFDEWIDEYELTITSPYSDTKARMEQYGVKSDSWTNDNELYLTSMDSLKNVIGRKQRQLDKVRDGQDYKGPRTAAEFYGIWSLSGYRGQQKIRVNTNFDNSYYVNPQSSDNVFLYRYPQAYAEAVLGRVNQMFKLYNWNVRHLTELLEQEHSANFTRQIHPDSLCMQHLLRPVINRIKLRKEKLYIE